jgi:hypothetical protein
MTSIHSALRATTLALIAAFAVALPAAAATSGYTETWDGAGNLAGWFPNTIDSTVVNPGAGGNTGGYLETRRSGSFPIGAATDLAAATGSFGSQVWTAKADLIGLVGATSDVWLRFRFQDSSHNGWRYRLTGLLDQSWQTFSVTFDSQWTDVQAQAHGWQTDFPSGFGSVGWAQTLSNVYTTEIRIEGSTNLAAGIDNFSLTAVPEPSSDALAVAGLGLVGWMARRRIAKPKQVS